jgi:hypothetical protein
MTSGDIQRLMPAGTVRPLGSINHVQLIRKALFLDQICNFQPENIEPTFGKNLKRSNGIDR